MNAKVIGERIRESRIDKGRTLQSIADDVGVAKSTIQRYEAGNIDKIKIPVLEAIARSLGVSPSWMSDKSDVKYIDEDSAPAKSILRIPIYGKIPAGVPMEAIEDVIDIEEVSAEWSKGGKEYFALQITGDSMSPLFLGGDVIIFLRQQTCDSGQDCCVMVDGSDATFKRVFRDEKGIKLQPLNPAHEVMFYDNDEIESLPVRILGVAHELRRGLR